MKSFFPVSGSDRSGKAVLIFFISSQFYYGALNCDVPRVGSLRHSGRYELVDVGPQSVCRPETDWLRWYRQVVGAGGCTKPRPWLRPSRWMLEQIEFTLRQAWPPLL